ncbi:iron chaperone [Herbiconiux liukaitaii]|uniref:iron chaperone n=1 Tax=Herbiconiux liukaitaii TaxID=3342799 RepID=UPI0035BA5FD9
MADPTFETVEEYIASFPPEVGSALEQLRALLLEALPDATESISYGMPTYAYGGKNLTFFAGWKAHLALYGVHSFDDDTRLEKLVAPYRSGQDTLKFSLAKPLPTELITRVVTALRTKRIASRR